MTFSAADVEEVRELSIGLVWRVAGEYGLTYSEACDELRNAFAHRLQPQRPKAKKRDSLSRAVVFSDAKRVILEALSTASLQSEELARAADAAGVAPTLFQRARKALATSGAIVRSGGGGYGEPLTWHIAQAPGSAHLSKRSTT